MKFEPVWNRSLHQVLNPKAFIVCGSDLYITEKKNYLTKIDIYSGDTKWSVKIPDSWGWLSSYKSNLYYMAQLGDLIAINKMTGKVEKTGQTNSFYPGYVVPSEKIIITGGWRGYTDIEGYDSITFKKKWSKITKSQEPLKFSVPFLLNDNLLFTANHSTEKIEIINIHTGESEIKINLPSELSCPDLGRSYQIIDGKITFVSKIGKIYSLAVDYSHLQCEDLEINCILTTLPFFSDDNMIYEEENKNFSLYSRRERKVLWSCKIENNFKTQLYACKLEKESYLLAGSLGQLKVVDIDGNVVGNIKSEKRITTPITRVKDLLIYGNKSEVKVVRFSTTNTQ